MFAVVVGDALIVWLEYDAFGVGQFLVVMVMVIVSGRKATGIRGQTEKQLEEFVEYRDIVHVFDQRAAQCRAHGLSIAHGHVGQRLESIDGLGGRNTHAVAFQEADETIDGNVHYDSRVIPSTRPR